MAFFGTRARPAVLGGLDPMGVSGGTSEIGKLMPQGRLSGELFGYLAAFWIR